jgi:DNA-binding CsgD family transcriptional regulator
MQSNDPEMTIARLSALTPAEQAVLDQALTGVTAREIAEHLSLSEATVRSHLSSIYVKLGVSGRVALLAHFRGSEAAAHFEPPVASRPLEATAAGWGWGILALLAGAYAVYGLSRALAYGGSQEEWILVIGFAILGAFGTLLARAILRQPSRGLMTLSLWAALGGVAFAIRGMLLGPIQLFLILGVASIAIGGISFRARSSPQH